MQTENERTDAKDEHMSDADEEGEEDDNMVFNLDNEWSKVWEQSVWDDKVYKMFHAVRYEAQRNGVEIHLGKLFGICVEKGSELADDDPRRNTSAE